MSKDLLFLININEFKRDEIVTVGDPDFPTLTDDVAKQMVTAGYANWVQIDIEDQLPFGTQPDSTISEDQSGEAAGEVDPETEDEPTEAVTQRRRKRAALKDKSEESE